MTQIGFGEAAALLLDKGTIECDRPPIVSDDGGIFMEMQHSLKQRRRKSKGENFDKYFSSGSRKVSHTRACCFLCCAECSSTCFAPAAAGMFLSSRMTHRAVAPRRARRAGRKKTQWSECNT